MQYVGMPHSWEDFYYKELEEIIRKFKHPVSQEVVKKSFQILKEFNPRINYREIEYSAEYIFTKILEPWHMDVPIQSCIETFWSGLQLTVEIYPETMNVLQKLKKKGYTIATLTDLPNAMPDDIFRRDISKLLGYFDYYVSSSVAGYRKPNCKGLQMISEKFAFLIAKLIFIGDEEKDRRTASTKENIRGILEYCIEAKVYGIICFGMGLTLREGNREYFYNQLDRLFPHMKEKYMHTYGTQYHINSPKSSELMKLFHQICENNGILHDNAKIFEYLCSFEGKNSPVQLNLFD